MKSFKADYSGHTDSLHPCPEAALSFKRGDILELLVTADEHWWQARSFGSGAFAFSSQGLILSFLHYHFFYSYTVFH